MCLVIAWILLVGCHDPDDFVGLGDGESFDLRIALQQAEADGATPIEVTATLRKVDYKGTRTVKFATTSGTWKGSDGTSTEVVADLLESSIVAFALLVAPRDTGKAVITATLGGFSKKDSLQFGVARPTRLHLEAGTFALDTLYDKTTTVSASLRRDIGFVTPGRSVSFAAERADSSGTGIGTFRAETSIASRYSSSPTTISHSTRRFVESLVTSISALMENIVPGGVVSGTARVKHSDTVPLPP